MDYMQKVLNSVNDFVWGPVRLVFLVGTGIYLTIRLKFLPWRNLGSSLKTLFSRESRRKGSGQGDISPFSALMTALAATVGTGNIVGVATAMVMGGPGRWFGCGFRQRLKYPQNMLNVRLPVNTAQKTSEVKCAEALCTH